MTSTYPLLTQSCSTNDSVGWLPVDHHILVLLQRSQQQQQQQQHVLPQHPVLLQYTLLQHPLSSKDNANTSSDILAAGSHATAAAALIPGSTSTHTKVNVAATLGQKMSSVSAYFTKLHRRFRPRDEPGQERHAACVAETARSVVCTPTTVPRDPTFAQGIILYYIPEEICQK